jgi:hypothetical protein
MVVMAGLEEGQGCIVHGELHVGNNVAGWMMNPRAPHSGRLEAEPHSVRLEVAHEVVASTCQHAA